MNDEEVQPIRLTEDEDTGDRFLVYSSNGDFKIEIRFSGDSLWMTQSQIGQLFGRDISSISRHIQNILVEGELDEQTSLQKVQTTTGRPATVYSLDMVISVGYRVSSTQATIFRRWATGILVQYAKKGFVVDAQRLKGAGNLSRIKELREIIRDIRSDEANLYAELRSICAMCQDYDGSTETARKFFQQTQAKLVYAVTSQTPSEIVASRANHNSQNMGLTAWPNENIRKADVGVAKNFLAEAEIKELNRLTSILLDIFEDQADIGQLVLMKDAETLLDKQLVNLNRVVLRSGGRIKSTVAKATAERQFEKYKAEQKALRIAEAQKNISDLTKEGRDLRGK